MSDYYERAGFAIESDAMGDEELLWRVNRGVPIVETWARWLVATTLFAIAFVVLAEAFIALSHSGRTLASLSTVLATACAIVAGLLWMTLRAEELRLARELRTARSGTVALRAMVADRRNRVPSLARLLSTKLGTAAVLLADGDRSDALEMLERDSPLMQGGRLRELRGIVAADVERAAGTSAALDRCVRQLRAMSRIGNREADLYRTHVLVKALLEQGDADAALQVARELEASQDDEERVYVAWLRTWFDLDLESSGDSQSWRTLSEGELRMATLLARAHGAEQLVEKLDVRVAAIARQVEGE